MSIVHLQLAQGEERRIVWWQRPRTSVRGFLYQELMWRLLIPQAAQLLKHAPINPDHVPSSTSPPTSLQNRASRRTLVIRNNSEKVNIKESGLNSVENDTVRNNLMGKSRFMDKKGWVDAQGRKGKGYGVYRFADKYGANVDGYSPIYTPDRWTESGSSYKLGTKGLIAWAGLVVVLLGIGATLIISTSQLGS